MTESLHTKYRPQDWDQIFGHDAAVAQLEKIVERRSSQAFLFSGPSGVGKTTLARIAAAKLGCIDGNVMEIPGAVYTGVEEMRGIQDTLQFQPFGDNPSRAVILDECHRLSGNAWDSLLKIIEEPPPDTFWFFATTDPSKIKDTIKTRCIPIRLKPLHEDDLTTLVMGICELENITLDDSIRQLVVARADGSPRQALVNLEACRDAKNRAAAARILDAVEAGDVTGALCRLLASGNVSWAHNVVPLLPKLRDENPEGVRIVICNYMAAALEKVTTDREAVFFHNILAAFAYGYGPSDGRPMLYNSIMQCCANDAAAD